MNSKVVVAYCCVISAYILLAPSLAGAQGGQYPQAPPQKPYFYGKEDRERWKEDRERWKEEREREKEWRKEERERERQERRAQQWYGEQWRQHNERYFGGPVVQPYPGESHESFIRRVRQQCNAQWNRCASYCNTIRDPYQRAACVSNCNNELYECSSGY